MPSIVVNEKKIEVDEDGFIVDPDEWNEDVARAFAATEGLSELTEDHWKVIRYLRDYFCQFQIAPMIRKLCKETGFSLNTYMSCFPPAQPRAPAK